MRHAKVPVNTSSRDAWLRCMNKALCDESIDTDIRGYLVQRFAEVADFLRNQPD